jgi:hypothetical protein
MTDVHTQFLQIDRLESSLDTDRRRYASASPFPHIVIDGVVSDDVFNRACAEFPPVDSSGWTSYLHVNERKYANSKPDTWQPTLQAIAREFTSPRFVAYLEELTGHRDLLADWSMDGGGLHQSVRGGYLNLHADFTSHHTNRTWRRRVNILLYLNAEWDDQWGGQLEFWNDDRTECVERVAPTGNRLVVFTTDEKSYHGHPDPMTCPDHIGRQSMALYYFQEEESPLIQATDYRARPGDGMKSAAIYADKKLLSAYDILKRRLHLSDAFASDLLEVAQRLRPKHGRPRR